MINGGSNHDLTSARASGSHLELTDTLKYD